MRYSPTPIDTIPNTIIRATPNLSLRDLRPKERIKMSGSEKSNRSELMLSDSAVFSGTSRRIVAQNDILGLVEIKVQLRDIGQL